MARFCKNCGAELDESSVFCDECGTIFGEDGSSNNVNHGSHNPFSMYKVDMIEGERIIKSSVMHSGCLIPPTIVAGLGFLLGLYSYVRMVMYSYHYYSPSPLLLIVLILFDPLFIIGIIWLIIRFISYNNTDLILTNKRVFGKCGLISTTQMQCPLNKINSISYTSGLIGRLIGYGTVRISSGATHYKFRFIRDGQTLYSDIFHNFELAEKEKIFENAEAIADAIGRRID